MAVHLGCSQEEREEAQEVRVSVRLQFVRTPLASVTDRLEQTVCYAKVCEVLAEVGGGRSFCLIEKLAEDCLKALKQEFPQVHIQLDLHKVRPPVEGLLGGVSYCCGDSLSCS